PLGRNGEGHPQYRRRTDGMRCVLLPGAEVCLGGGRVPVERFLVDAEPVSNTAVARFLNAVGKGPPATGGAWCGAGVGRHRAGQFPLWRIWGRWGRWRPVWGAERQPMILVSWYGANAYSLWANRHDWRYYRGDGAVPGELEGLRVDASPPPAAWMGS